MLQRRVHVTLFGEPSWITTAEDSILRELVWNKITPPDRQMGDAAGVVAVHGAQLVAADLKKWAELLASLPS